MHFLNLMFFHVQQVPGVLKCRCRSISLPQGGLDPRITRCINEAGFEGLFRVLDLAIDHVLIIALVECWYPETHTFHLPHGEMGITLQDIEVMLGVHVDSFLMVGKTNLMWKDVCEEFLGFTPPPSIPHPNETSPSLLRRGYKSTGLLNSLEFP